MYSLSLKIFLFNAIISFFLLRCKIVLGGFGFRESSNSSFSIKSLLKRFGKSSSSFS